MVNQTTTNDLVTTNVVLSDSASYNSYESKACHRQILQTHGKYIHIVQLLWGTGLPYGASIVLFALRGDCDSDCVSVSAYIHAFSHGWCVMISCAWILTVHSVKRSRLNKMVATSERATRKNVYKR